MMKFLMSVLMASFALVPLATTAKAADYAAAAPADTSSGLYFRGDVGGSWLNWSTATSPWAFTGGAGVGYQFDPNFRTDLTWNWAGNYTVAPGASVQTSVVMGNIYYDWKNDTAFTPYVGAGVGYGWQWSDNTGLVPNNQGLAVGLAAGVAYDMTNNLALDVGYKFNDIVNSTTSVPEHQGTVGLRVKF
jgi:opacity protein-like surface antigen